MERINRKRIPKPKLPILTIRAGTPIAPICRGYLGLQGQHHDRQDRILIKATRSLGDHHGFNHTIGTPSEGDWKFDVQLMLRQIDRSSTDGPWSRSDD